MIKNGILLLFSLCIMLASCSEEEILTYNRDADGIYFVNDSTVEAPELVNPVDYSFLNNPGIDVDTVYFPVRVSGNLSDYDRTFNAVVVEGENTTGTSDQYEVLAGTVPAWAYYGYLPIVVNKTDELLEEEFTLELQLIASGDFMNMDQNLFNAYLNYSSLIIKPDLWDDYLYYWFGDYSRNFYTLIVNELGNEVGHHVYELPLSWLSVKDWGFFTLEGWLSSSPDPVMNGYKDAIAIALEEYEAENGEPLKHNDGTVVVLPD